MLMDNEDRILLSGYLFWVFLGLLPTALFSQNIELGGEVAALGNFFHHPEVEFQSGIQYLPSLRVQYPLAGSRTLDLKITANLSSFLFFPCGGKESIENKVSFYRYWLRYSSNPFEIRLGNQKINFGKAKLLRPLMWFDQIDPRDPLQLTDGVKAVLVRYYFLNNANIWCWLLFHNPQLKGLEFIPGEKNGMEYGGRIQYPVGNGEVAVSFHHRKANPGQLLQRILPGVKGESFGEDRFALDGQWDLGVGFWFESALIHYRTRWFFQKWQKMLTLGTDYTLPLGSGMHLLVEQLFHSFTPRFFSLKPIDQYSGFWLDYPLNILDHILAISFYNWPQKEFYHYISWNRSYDRIRINVSLFLMPQQPRLPLGQTLAQMGGNGLQLLLIYDY